MCAGWCAAARIDLNGIIDPLYSLITLGISRPDGGFSLLTGLQNPLLREQPISSQLISDKPMEFCVGLCPFIPPYVHCLICLRACVHTVHWKGERVERLTGQDVCVCSEQHVCVQTNGCIFSCVCEDPRTFIYVCIWVYVRLSMCLCDPYSDLFP